MENSFLDRFFKFVFYQPLWIHILICAICVWGWIQLGRIITRKKIWQYINVILFMGSLGNIIWQTLLFRKEKVRIIRVIPLLNLITSASTRGIMRSMLMNVFLFVPFGMTMPYFLFA